MTEDHELQRRRRRLARGGRCTGLQLAEGGLAAAIEYWEGQMERTEFAVLIDLHARFVEAKRRRTAAWLPMMSA